MRTRRLLLAIIGVLLSSCAAPPRTSVATPAPTPFLTATPIPEGTSLPPPSSYGLTLWVAPFLSPATTSEAGALLATELQAFQASHPTLSIEVRVKELSGPSGLLDTLTSASVAAPSTLPDMISLNAFDLNTAMIKGLIVTQEGLLPIGAVDDWYEHALAVAGSPGIYYGMPFASDAQVLAYRLELYDDPPTSWSAILNGPAGFLFPAADPVATLTLQLYDALGGTFRDTLGRPSLDEQTMTDVLSLYGALMTGGVLSTSANRFASTSETWQAFAGYRSSSAVVSLSDLLAGLDPSRMGALPLPTHLGQPISPTSTWSWALVSQDPQRQQLAAELLVALSAPAFLGPWTQALGLLPPTPGALAAWTQDDEASIVSALVTIARPGLSAEVLGVFGPPVYDAVQAVLTGTLTPEEASLAASQAIQNP